MQDNYLKLKNAIEEVNNIVVFSGAGLSDQQMEYIAKS